MKTKAKIGIAAAVLAVAAVSAVTVMLYQKDTQTVQQARVVRAYFVNFCMENARYPKKEEFDKRFEKLAANPDWFYWPAEDLKTGTFQYPMSLPVPSAPGESKFSEFMPIIYSYAVRNPCETFSRELL